MRRLVTSRLIRMYTVCHYQDLHCLLLFYWFLTEPLFAIMDVSKLRDGWAHFRISGANGLKRGWKCRKGVGKVKIKWRKITCQKDVNWHTIKINLIANFYNNNSIKQKGSLKNIRAEKTSFSQRSDQDLAESCRNTGSYIGNTSTCGQTTNQQTTNRWYFSLSFFSKKIKFVISCKLSPVHARVISLGNVKSYFLEKNVSKCRLLHFYSAR